MENRDFILGELTRTQRNGIENLMQYLRESDFFETPASTKYHGNFKGGLAEHSIRVMELLDNKNETFQLGLTKDTVIIAGLLHDICKVNYYTTEQRWRKDDNGRWEAYYPYVVKDKLPLGHGEKSVILLQQFIILTTQETLMIRWHMGLAEPKDNHKDMNNAIKMCPEIVALHCADFEASTFLEKTVEV